MDGPEDPTPDPHDMFGRRGELLDAIAHRLHHGPPMSKWDWLAIRDVAPVIGLELAVADG